MWAVADDNYKKMREKKNQKCGRNSNLKMFFSEKSQVHNLIMKILQNSNTFYGDQHQEPVKKFGCKHFTTVEDVSALK